MYQPQKTLPYRLEMYRQIKRKRTLFSYLFVISLPVIVALAVKFGTSGNSSGPTRFGSGTADLIGLATKGAANFTTTMVLLRDPISAYRGYFDLQWRYGGLRSIMVNAALFACSAGSTDSLTYSKNQG